MKQRLIRACKFLTVFLLVLSPQLFTHYSATATGVTSPAVWGEKPAEPQSGTRQVVARVKIEFAHHRKLLARTGLRILSEYPDNLFFIMTTDAIAEVLRREGWEIEILYARDYDEFAKWSFVAHAPQGECVYTLDPTSRAFVDVGGTSTFDIETDPDCEWQAIPSESWITINGLSQGVGPKTISFSVAANNSPDRRAGFIFVAGQILDVFQGALFSDVPPTHPFYSEIGKISARGITLGCGSGMFCPNDVVTREQMAAFIIRALGELNPPTPGMQRFADVPPSNPFYNFIDRLAELQITLGCGGGNYCPSDPVLREQMAALLIRALGEFNPPTPATQRFVDVPPTNQFYNFIDRLAALNITQGCSPTQFCPLEATSRGQMAAFLVRTFGL